MVTKEQLKKMRLSAGLSQSQLAKKLGTGYKDTVVYNFESGIRKIGISVLERWLKACNCSVTYKNNETNEEL